MQIIGLIGQARAGKSVLAEEIARIAYTRNMTPQRMSWAQPMRDAVALLGITKEGTPDMYRKLLQVLGTDILRNPDFLPGFTGPNFHVDLTVKRIREMAKTDRLVTVEHTVDDSGQFGHTTQHMAPELALIFDDVRFPNEVEALRKLGAALIYVDRGAQLPDQEAPFRAHASENLARDLRDPKVRQDMGVSWYLSSEGSMQEYMIRARPFIPVWLGLEAMGLPRHEEQA